MQLRDVIFRSLGPGAFTGVTLGNWIKILRDNRFSVDGPFWARAAIVTLNAIPNTLISGCEAWLYNQKIGACEVHSALFILGAWRSGTTHLHNLLTIDDRFGFPNYFQVTFPKTFLLTERTTSWLVNLCLPKTRPQDNVRFGVSVPQEEEFAFCSLTGLSVLLVMAFPRNAQFYDRFLDFHDASESEMQQWKDSFVWFLKKLTFKHHRPLVLKSPGHTCRIEILLDLFPDAKFVHIHRNPYEVIQSAQHTLRKAQPWWQLQRGGDNLESDRILNHYKEMYDGFFCQRHLIPAGRFHEIAFEDLERDPVGRIAATYEALNLPDFTRVQPQLQSYVDSLVGYQKNVFPALSPDERTRVSTECGRCFEEWGYSK